MWNEDFHGRLTKCPEHFFREEPISPHQRSRSKSEALAHRRFFSASPMWRQPHHLNRFFFVKKNKPEALAQQHDARSVALQLLDMGSPRYAHKSSQIFGHADPNSLSQRCLSNSGTLAPPQQHMKFAHGDSKSPPQRCRSKSKAHAQQQNVRQNFSVTCGKRRPQGSEIFSDIICTCGTKLTTSKLSFRIRGPSTETTSSETRRCTRFSRAHRRFAPRCSRSGGLLHRPHDLLTEIHHLNTNKTCDRQIRCPAVALAPAPCQRRKCLQHISPRVN